MFLTLHIQPSPFFFFQLFFKNITRIWTLLTSHKHHSIASSWSPCFWHFSFGFCAVKLTQFYYAIALIFPSKFFKGCPLHSEQKACPLNDCKFLHNIASSSKYSISLCSVKHSRKFTTSRPLHLMYSLPRILSHLLPSRLMLS